MKKPKKITLQDFEKCKELADWFAEGMKVARALDRGLPIPPALAGRSGSKAARKAAKAR